MANVRVQKSNRPKGVELHFVGSDIHEPFHDKNCAEAFCALMEDLKPDGLIVAGDFTDLFEVSSHNKRSVLALSDKRIATTWKVGRELLEQYTTAAGKSCKQRHFLRGNHEDRLDRWLQTGDNAVFEGDDAVDLAKRLDLAGYGFTDHPDTGSGSTVQLGHLLVTHGQWCTKNHAKKHLDEYQHSVMYGHTHRPQVHYAGGWGTQRVAVGLGHMALPDSQAMSYKKTPSDWVQGFALVYVFPDGSFNINPINFWQGQFVHANRVYGKRARS